MVILKIFLPLKKYKNISSYILLNKTKQKLTLSMFVENLDCTIIICQKIRLEKHKKLIKKI